ncbi:hypothetical protein MTO96_011556 [Rhipicephalus appendiculatus]
MPSNPASAEASVLASGASVRRCELYDPPQLSKKRRERYGIAESHSEVDCAPYTSESRRVLRVRRVRRIAPLRAGTSRARRAPTSGVPKEEPTRDVTPINFRFLLSPRGSPRSARPMEARSS